MKTNLLEAVPKRRSTLCVSAALRERFLPCLRKKRFPAKAQRRKGGLALATLILACSFASHVVGQVVAPNESAETKTMRVIALRLRPGQDLRQQLETFVKKKQIRAGFIITTVGSLRHAAIRLADQPSASQFDGKFEIVSLVGTLGRDGVHLHLSVSDSTGKTIGGHLVEGCVIYTTAEIVIGEAEGLTFSREKDAETTYQELRIRSPRKTGSVKKPRIH